MGPKSELHGTSGMVASTPAATVAAELRYERASTALELLAKDEDLRKTRVRNLLLGNEIDELNDKLCEEFGRGDAAELDAQSWRAKAEDVTERLERAVNELRSRSRELETLKAELLSLQDVSADSTKLLTEKLALSREVAQLKPEVEHLRSQANANQGILAEKLSLQRQLSTVQAELENEKRTVQRLSAKESRSGEQTVQYEAQMDELRKELAKEQRERQKAERVAGRASEEQVEELKKELAKEKRDRQKAEKAASKASEEQIEELKKELANEKREREKVDKSASKAGDERLEELRKDLAKEKRERQNDDKEARRTETEWKTQKAVLDDKLDQFRTKLRSTKEKLKETEAELAKAQATALARPSVAEAKVKNPRKRGAAQMDPDAAIGTPGDAVAAKRGKRASSVVGEKSTFSITPFLNRTASVAPESPPKEQEEEALEVDEPIASIEDPTSPSAVKSKAASTVKKPKTVLGNSSSTKNNRPAAGARQKAAAPLTLEKVAEEGEATEDVENEAPAAKVAATAHLVAKAAKPALKPKQLNTFASFRDASLPPQPQQKKKQKLLGGVGKTIFDEDEEGDEAGALKIGFGAQRTFGAFGGRGFGGVSLLQPKNKGPLVVAPDGFMFSPLKKDRKAMAAGPAAAR